MMVPIWIQLLLTSTGNISGVTFTVTGTDASGSSTEDITGKQ